MGSFRLWVAALLCVLVAAFNKKPFKNISTPDLEYLQQEESFPNLGHSLDGELRLDDLGQYVATRGHEKPPFKSLSFKTIHGTPLTLDIHTPEEVKPEKNLPAVFYFHPGGWILGNRKLMTAHHRKLIGEGYVVVAVDYRLVPEKGKWGGASTIWPSQGEDAADAVKWVRKHGSKYGIDTERLGCWGDSAGGQLCAWLATHGSMHSSTKLNVAVVMFAPSCLLCWPEGVEDSCSKDAYFGFDKFSLNSDYYFGFEKQSLQNVALAKCKLSEEQKQQLEIIRSAEATHWITKSKHATAPTFIGHGRRDETVTVEKSYLLAKALKKAGVSHKLYIVEKGGHGYVRWSEEPIDAAIDFIKEQMYLDLGKIGPEARANVSAEMKAH